MCEAFRGLLQINLIIINPVVYYYGTKLLDLKLNKCGLRKIH